MAKNRYTRALKVLKNSQVDEKLQMLESLPTNNTTGLYVVEPAIVNTVTVPGEVDREADFTQDGDGEGSYDGTDTTGLFLTDGTILTIEPPGDTSYILGPMASMWYAWGNFTQIGYIRQSDRKMVNLARITGELGSWDGSSNFTSYGQLTLEQAVWFQGTPKLNGADNDTPNYRAFYPGPPSNVADEHGRYLCVITGTPKSTSREEEQRTPDVMGDAESQGYPWEKKKARDEDKDDELMQLILNAAMLGLDIAAVVALLFPEPASSAAGAAHLATKLRYVAKLRRMRGALNPFGQRAVRSGAAGRRRVPVYSGRPYRGKRGFGKTTYGTTDPKTAATYSNPGPLKGTPGTGSRVNPRGTVDRGTLPQRYIDKYGSRSVLGQKQVKLGPKAARRTFGEDYEYIQEQITIRKLFEEAAAGNVSGMEAADGYVDEVSKTSSPEQLEKASNDANNIAKEGGQGVSDTELAQIDKDAETEVKRVTANLSVSDPESMTDDQLFDAFGFMYESNQDLAMELSDQFEDLIDRKAIDAAYKEYKDREEYLSSKEFEREASPEYAKLFDMTEYLWDTFMSRVDTVPDPSPNNPLGWRWIIDGGNSLTRGEYETLHKWGDGMIRRGKLYSDVIWPEKKKQLELNLKKYQEISDAAYRPHFVAVINAWNIMFRSSLDPYSLDEPVPHDLVGDLALLGISYGASVVLIQALGAAGVATLTKSRAGLTKIKAWWNQGRNVRVPGENQANWKDLRIDDKLQGSKFVKKGSRGKDKLTDADFEGGALPTNLDQLGQLLQGKGGFTWQLTRGLKTGPTALTRQLIERPFRTILKFFESSDLKGNILTEETSSQKALYDALDAALKETDPKDFGKVIDRFLAMIEDQISKKKAMESYQPKFLQQRGRQLSGKVLSESQKRILRDIKKPVQVKEMPTKFKVKPTGRRNKTVGADMMKIPDTPNQYKPPAPNIWASKDRQANIRASQEKKNEVLELVGAAEHHWTYLTEESRRKKQEKVNEMMSAENDKQMQLLYEKYRMKEAKITKAMSAFRKPTDVAPEYPENPPPQLDPETGMHPKYGKKYKHDKLDPHSAEAMPPTGDPVIDANVKKATNAKEKARKLKVLMGKTKRG